ncbi:hypothetical protein M3J09_009721 [Ascochyta lentis]
MMTQRGQGAYCNIAVSFLHVVRSPTRPVCWAGIPTFSQPKLDLRHYMVLYFKSGPQPRYRPAQVISVCPEFQH